jgi:hypothetical protein
MVSPVKTGTRTGTHRGRDEFLGPVRGADHEAVCGPADELVRARTVADRLARRWLDTP